MRYIYLIEEIKWIFDLKGMPLLGKIRYITYLMGFVFFILVCLTRGFGTESDTMLITYVVIGALLIAQI